MYIENHEITAVVTGSLHQFFISTQAIVLSLLCFVMLPNNQYPSGSIYEHWSIHGIAPWIIWQPWQTKVDYSGIFRGWKYKQNTRGVPVPIGSRVWSLYNTYLTHCDLVTSYGNTDLAHVMAYCLMAPKHYLNQCRLFISEAVEVTWEQSQTYNECLSYNFV